jgi:hypothetical protein
LEKRWKQGTKTIDFQPLSPSPPSHNIACEIQATLPAPPSTIKRMMTSVNVTFILTALCYFSVAITGFWAFGNSVKPNVLVSLDKPVGVIVAANLAVFLHVMGERG